MVTWQRDESIHPVKTELFATWGEFWWAMGKAFALALPIWVVLVLLMVLAR